MLVSVIRLRTLLLDFKISIWLEERREIYIHLPDVVILGVGKTIFETQMSGPWTLGSKNGPS